MSISRYISSPITSAVFIKHFLFIGQGSKLQIYTVSDEKSHLEINYRAFISCNIHGIKPDSLNVSNGKGGFQVKVCLTGGRIFRIIKFDNWNAVSRLEPVSEVIKLQDWIWDVQWLHDDTENVSILTAQNYIVLWNYKQMKQTQVKKCEESCILYSGIIVGRKWSDLAVLSGTVFSEVLIWNPTSELVLHRLKGHDGVIFSINYNDKLRKLCTGSDDRSIQIFHHELLAQQDHDECVTASQWKTSSFILLCKLYGHEARIWKVVSTKRCFVSVGEDSLLCFWTYDDKIKCGKMCKKILMHNGSSIWSVAVNDAENLIATGGGNGGLKLWNLYQQHAHLDKNTCDSLQISLNKNDGSTSTVKKTTASELDYPRSITFLDNENLLIMSNEGIIYVYHIFNTLTPWFEYDKFKSYSVVDVNRYLMQNCLVAVGNLNGEVTILETETHFELTSKQQQLKLFDRGVFKPYEHKVLALKWLDSSSLLTCGSRGSLDLYEIRIVEGKMEFTFKEKFELPQCRQRWFSTATILKNSAHTFLFCGCRSGGLFLYKMGNKVASAVGPIQSFPKIHGMHGVTHIHVDENLVQTTGRDGFIRVFQLKTNSLCELNKIWVAGCSKWIAGLVTRSTDLLIYGFHSDNFVVWSEQHEMIILEIPCGGGHRSWDFFLQDSHAMYAYIKDREVTVCRTQLKKHMPITIKPGFHTKEICNIHFLFSVNDMCYFATASEDTTVKILRYENIKDDVSVVTTLKSHISSVRAICSCMTNETDNDRLLVTCGGRAQMVVWRIRATATDTSPNKIIVEQLTSHMLLSENRRSKKPWLQTTFIQDPETRYMDICIWSIDKDKDCYMIALACSDSYLRVFGLNVSSKRLKLLIEDSYHEHCLLKIEHVSVHKHSVILTAATDGKVAIWDVTVIEETFVEEELMKKTIECEEDDDLDRFQADETCIKQQNYRIIYEIQLHQSGITALAIDISECNETLPITTLNLVTGGDDSGIKLTQLQIQDNGVDLIAAEIDRATIKIAHTAQITGILILTDCYVVTVSVDRRICVWKHRTASTESENSSQLELIECIFSSVSDISSVTLLSSSSRNKKYSIAVAGMGFETFDINL